MENLIPVGLFILCLAGAVALLALAYFLYILVKIIRNTVNEKVNPMLDDAADVYKRQHQSHRICVSGRSGRE